MSEKARGTIYVFCVWRGYPIYRDMPSDQAKIAKSALEKIKE